MTPRLKRSLVALASIAALTGVLWMRSIASWRPQTVMVLPKNYAAFHLSPDGRFLTAQKLSPISAIYPDDRPFNFTTFDLQTSQNYQWPLLAKVKIDPRPDFGWSPPFYWQRTFSKTGDVLELEDPVSRQVKHRLPYQKRGRFPSTLLKVEGNVARVVNAFSYQEFDLTHDHLTRLVKLNSPFAPTLSGAGTPLYALSPDGRRIYGCLNSQGRVWDTSNGKQLKSWTLNANSSPVGFSPDARIALYLENGEEGSNWHFVETATGKLKWTSQSNSDVHPYTPPLFCSPNEVVLPQQNNCEIRDASTGRIVRQLPGPRLADPIPFANTPDWIYTDDAQSHILRWRAR